MDGSSMQTAVRGFACWPWCGAFGAGPAWAQIPEWFGQYRIAADFELREVNSKRTIKLSDYFKPESKAQNVVVLVFTGVGCPIGDLYMPRLVELAEVYKSKGVTFLAINSNAHETAHRLREQARRFKLPFPVLKDPGNVVADVNLVERTCEVLVIARMREIQYHGPIDDQYGLGVRKDAPTRRYLADALDAVLAGAHGRHSGDAGRRLSAGPGRAQRGDAQGPAGSGRRCGDHRGVRRARAVEPDQGRTGNVRPTSPDPPAEVPVVPSTRPGRAVPAPDLR